MTAACRCASSTVFQGVAAEDYARSHLTHVKTNDDTWRSLFVCRETGTYWRESFPTSEAHGGGPPVLEILSDEAARAEFGSDIVAR